MQKFFILEEDRNTAGELYLGRIELSYCEGKAMILGDITQIPNTPLLVPIIYKAKPELADYSNQKFPLVSSKIKGLIDEYVNQKIFFRNVILTDNEGNYPFYYIVPPSVDGIDYKNSRFKQDPRIAGVLQCEKGFYIRPSVMEGMDIFLLRGLSRRKVIISQRFKQIMDVNGVNGIDYIDTVTSRMIKL